jgi:hypothetical protein
MIKTLIATCFLAAYLLPAIGNDVIFDSEEQTRLESPVTSELSITLEMPITKSLEWNIFNAPVEIVPKFIDADWTKAIQRGKRLHMMFIVG